MKLPIYMDAHATTALDPRVLEAMTPYFLEQFGNASSKQHAFGWRAEQAVQRCRAQLATVIGARDPNEIIFTSGATEANNLAIKGAVQALGQAHVVAVATEHASVLDAIENVTLVPVDEGGFVSPDAVGAALRDDTALCCVMLANNEIGVLQPIAEIAQVCRARGVWLLVDAAQAVGKVPVDVEALGVDLLSFTAHKMHGPKGIGALWARRSRPAVRLAAQMHGGGHERGLRAGTLNVPGIVGFAEAAQLAHAGLEQEMPRLARLRDRLRDRIVNRLGGVYTNGSMVRRLPGNLNLSFADVDGEALLLAVRDLAVSSGSACASANLEPSHVLRALGRSHELAHAALRFGLHRFTTEEEVDYAADHVVAQVTELRRRTHAEDHQ